MREHWFKGSKDREARRKEVLGYRNAFDELKEILNQHYRKKDAVLDYDSPGWANKQIAVNEYNRVLDDLLNLITIEKD